MTTEEAIKPPEDLLKEVEEVAEGKKEVLHHTKTGPKSVTGLLSEVRQLHGDKDKVLHPAKAPPKSGTALMSEVRHAHGGKDDLKKAQTVDKQSLLQEVRSTSNRALDVEADK